ncbi:SNF2 family domain-containing protein [Colletotrichum graminicola M1.001]|uniref:SNF2 family domain-containing protein n=1 Tax=Colletotrichum graminicola (strain M1.001 / M2 / FGSC 10212) TaxID=645133 RepID=E3QCN0_COLGM|nr:SNF2 family domain-containing protein [Colletotrichum graminicola M1.001]EFQ28618.1 SNF2 family domain-containing protein [Colletotrichum graminicola M1.001]
MAGEEDDPYEWDVTQVVRELCGLEKRPWHPNVVTKRPDPATLSKALIDNDIDGETLLTYQDVMQSFDGIFQGLGLVKITHKMTFVNAVNYLRSKSRGYRAFRADAVKQEIETSTDPQEVQVNGNCDFAVPDHTGASESPQNRPPTHDVDMQGNSDDCIPASDLPYSQALPAQEPNVQVLMQTAHLEAPQGIGTGQETSEPAQKKRRTVPTLVSTDVLGVGNAPIRTAADDVTVRSYGTKDTLPQLPDSLTRNPAKSSGDEGNKFPVQEHASKAYFGPSGLTLDGQIPRSSLVQDTRDTDDGSSSFLHLSKGLIPAGRRLQVSRAMRRLFRSNNQSLALLQSGQSPYVEPDEEDKVLPVFGDSGDEDGYDTETREAIQKEEEELQREVDLKSQYLTRDEVERVIQDEIQQMEDSWDERKLPKKQRKANELWNKARRRGLIRHIGSATAKLEMLNTRIEKLCREIREDEWPNENQLRRQARSLECSVEDRKAERWLLGVLRGHEPPRPESMSKPRPTPARREILSDEDGEYLTSEDDDNDHFIVDDMMDVACSPVPDQSRPASPMNLDKPEELLQQGLHGPELPKSESPADNVVDIQSDNNIIDLTMYDSEPGSEKHTDENIICLDTPQKAKTPLASVPPSLPNSDIEERPRLSQEELSIPYEQPERIGVIAPKMWKLHSDNERLLISVIWRLDEQQRRAFFHTISTTAPPDIWTDFVMTALEDTEDDEKEAARETGTIIARLFRTYVFRKLASPASITKRLSERKARGIKGKVERFENFCSFVKEDVVPYFPNVTLNTASGSEAPRKNWHGNFDSLIGYSDDDIEESSSSKKRKRVVIVDQAAKDLRESDRRRREEQEERRKELRKKLAASGTISSDKSRLIINDAKKDNQGLVYVNEHIGKQIKSHQINGVRFMWNQIVDDSKVRQGCLLAHTMGLGKTMQVITLLVAIAESAQSEDESIRSQIPEELRQSKTLVLCPSVLVDNWMDELLMWAPDGLLGRLFKLEAITKAPERGPMVRRWDEEGGVLIIGYDMFKRLVDSPANELPSPHDAKSVKEILTQSPSLVVADEAHKMKNPNSKLATATAQFRTQSRIALTGSPLANSVLEFYYMIDWVAPGYLGPIQEFSSLYAQPIHLGLYEDSPKSAYRKAMKQLAVLEATVQPKTHRATIKSCLKDDLPPKMEFVLTVPVTPIQAKLYDTFLESLRKEERGGGKILGAVNSFCLIANHPKTFQTRLREERHALGKRDKSNLTLTSQIISDGLKITGLEKDISSPALSWKVRLLVAILNESESVGDKVLIFTQSIPTMDYLDSLFRQQKRKVARLDGNTPISQRQQNIKDFNSGDTQLYIISTAAGGTGLNIFGANRVVIFDFKYNPIHEQQAIGRAYRIGQQKPVYVYTFICGGTYEQTLHDRAIFKTHLASRVVDNENPKRWSTKEHEYLKDRTEPPQKDLSPFAGKDVVLDSLLMHPDLSQGIRSIIKTDTFEEDDITNILTQEDLKDVKDQVYMNSIRNTDPEKFHKLELERAGRLNAAPSVMGIAAVSQAAYRPPGLPPGGVQTPILPPLHPGLTARGSPYSLGQSVGIQRATAAEVPPSTVPAPEPAAAPSHKDGENLDATQQGSPQSVPDVALSIGNLVQQDLVESRGAHPMPIAGANTFFRGQQGPMSPSPADKSISSPSARKQTNLNSGIIKWPGQFEQKLLESVDKIADPELLRAIGEDKSDLCKRIASSTWLIRGEMNEGKLPDNSHMKKLCSLVENPRFSAAILTGHLPPNKIAQASTEKGLDNLVGELTQLDNDSFYEKLGLRKHSARGPDV